MCPPLSPPLPSFDPYPPCVCPCPGPGPLPLLPTLAPHSFLSLPLLSNFSGRWRMTPESVASFTQLMKAAKVTWQAFKGPLESSVIVHVRRMGALACVRGGGV